MQATTRNALIVTGGLLLLLNSKTAAGGYLTVLKDFLPEVEGFSPVPIWDVRQWSWGYGTPAGYDPNRKPAGTITRQRAWSESVKYINSDYNYLRPMITKRLNANQWAAFLSFSYNVGRYSADNLVSIINNNTPSAVVSKMKEYKYSDGQLSQGLINRRKKESDLYLSNVD